MDFSTAASSRSYRERRSAVSVTTPMITQTAASSTITVASSRARSDQPASGRRRDQSAAPRSQAVARSRAGVGGTAGLSRRA